MKWHKEEEALKILTKALRDEAKAKSQIREIKAALSVKKEHFLETLKFVLKWTNLQR